MVAEYYTTSFEKSSVPAMAQRASRGRRLGKVLKDVHESSNLWPRWEARGFRESAMESASKYDPYPISFSLHPLHPIIPLSRSNIGLQQNNNAVNAWVINIGTICVDEIEKVAQHLDRTQSSDGSESRSVVNALCINNANSNAMAVDADSSSTEGGLLAQWTNTLPDDVEAAVQDDVSLLSHYPIQFPLLGTCPFGLSTN